MKQKRQKGFALVVALTLMGFVLLLALSLMSLLRVEVTATESGDDRILAQQNALLALNNAIAELQVTLGPDQRISATADILAGTNDYKKNITGVWAGGPSSTPDVELYGNNYKPGDNIRWLVSDAVNASTGTPDPNYNTTPQASGAEAIVLIGEGSVIEDADKVSVYPTPMTRDETTIGHYAWWVGDEGVKARINLPATDVENMSRQDTERKLAAIRSRTQSEWSNIAGISDFSTLDLRTKAEGTRIGAPAQLQMKAEDAELVKKHFHNLTYNSRGVIADAYNGGLKGDLSLAFELDDDNFDASEFGHNANGKFTDGVKLSVYGADTDDLLTQTLFVQNDAVGPSWHLLRDYYRLYHRMESPMKDPKLSAQQSLPDRLMMKKANRAPGGSISSTRDAGHPVGMWGSAYQYALNNPDAITLNGKQLVLRELKDEGDILRKNNNAPTMIRASYWPYLNGVVEETGVLFEQGFSKEISPGNMRDAMKVHILQKGGFTFHNPYNVKMYMPETWLQMRLNTGGSVTSVSHPNDDTSLANLTGMGVHQNTGLRGAAGGDFEPGQLIYSAAIAPDGQKNPMASWTSRMGRGFISWEDSIRFGDSGNNYSKDKTNFAGFGSSLFIKPNLDPMHPTLPLEEPLEIAVFPTNNEIDFYVRAYVNGVDRDYERYQPEGNKMATPNSGNNGDAESNMSLLYLLDLGSSGIAANRWWDGVTTAKVIVANPEAYEYKDSTRGSPLVLRRAEWFLKPARSGTDSYPPFVFTNPTAPVQMGRNLIQPDEGFPVFSPDYKMQVTQSAAGMNPSFNTYGEDNDRSGGSGQRNVVLIDLPTSPPLSLGQLQNANISTLGYMPYFAIGNSFASPYMSSNQEIVRTNLENWKNNNRIFYDLSYLANKALWDSFFFSSYSVPYDATEDDYDEESYSPAYSFDAAFDPDYSGSFTKGALPNRRMSLYSAPGESISSIRNKMFTDSDTSLPLSSGYQRAAENLLINGAFNVNSTSVDAWAALLSAARGSSVYRSGVNNPETSGNKTPVSRLSQPLRGEWNGSGAGNDDAWAGFRNLSDTEIRGLAEKIVDEIKSRVSSANGNQPFISMSDFVNRAPNSGNSDQQVKGLIQAAIDGSGINSAFEGVLSMSATPSRLGSENFPNRNAVSGDRSAAAMAPGYILQGDILTLIGEAISVRSDTFRIRAYGSTVDPNNPEKVTAQAWCEAVVQRVPAPLKPSISSPNNIEYWGPRKNEINTAPNDFEDFRKFGRRFEIVEFRWLSPDEV